METQRIELSDGAWANVYAEMKHKTIRLVGLHMRQYLTRDTANLTIPGNGGRATITGDIDIDWASIDFTIVNDVIMLNQVESWSFGE
ncbi:MAG: hypothetical protein KAJ19_07245, partial [Gammaproteobacteria bacterium]|nr:hypothetical protein [Gammaproteobacteria bacterium]